MRREAQAARRAGRTHRAGSARPVAVAVWLCAAVVMAWLLLAGRTEAATGSGAVAVPGVLVRVRGAVAAVPPDGRARVRARQRSPRPPDTVRGGRRRRGPLRRGGQGRGTALRQLGSPDAAGCLRRRIQPRQRPEKPAPQHPPGQRAHQPEGVEDRPGCHRCGVAGCPDRGTGSRPAGAVSSKWNRPAIIVGILAVVWAILSAFADLNADPVAGSVRGRRNAPATPPPSGDFAQPAPTLRRPRRLSAGGGRRVRGRGRRRSRPGCRGRSCRICVRRRSG